MNKRTLNYEDFDLIRIKFSPKEGWEIDFIEKSGSKDIINIKPGTAAHEDLFEAIKALAPYGAQIFTLQKGWDFAREELRGDDEKLRLAVAGAKDADGRFTVSGIKFSGEGQNASVKITGSLRCLNGAAGVSTPLIRFKNTTMATEQTIEGLCEKVREETYLYLFKGKNAGEQAEMDLDKDDAQLNVVTESEKAEKTPKAEKSKAEKK